VSGVVQGADPTIGLAQIPLSTPWAGAPRPA